MVYNDTEGVSTKTSQTPFPKIGRTTFPNLKDNSSYYDSEFSLVLLPSHPEPSSLTFGVSYVGYGLSFFTGFCYAGKSETHPQPLDVGYEDVSN